jgi:hypothetical protein
VWSTSFWTCLHATPRELWKWLAGWVQETGSLPARMTSRYIASFRYGREHHWAKIHWNEGQARLRAVVPKVDGVVVWVRRLVRIRL